MVAATNPSAAKSMIFPGTPFTEGFAVSFTVPFTSDGGKFCTYDDARTVAAPVYFADDGGSIVAPNPADIVKEPPPTNVTARVPTLTRTPQTPQASKTPETPTAPADTPKTPTVPPDTPPVTTSDAPPVTTTDTPPVATTDTPTEIPDTVFVKATEAVLEGQPAGQPVPGQVVKLLPVEKPGLPGDQPSRAAQDTGFDKSPVQCTTEANGECRAALARGERQVYKLPTRGSSTAKQSYRVDVSLQQVSGGVLETTGARTKPDLLNTPVGARVVGGDIKIGDRTFLRVRAYADAGAVLSLREKFGRDAAKYDEDICRDKQPGPPLGLQPSSFSAISRDLPEASLRLDGAIRAKRVAR